MKSEQIQFSVRRGGYFTPNPESLLHLNKLDPFLWTELDRWDYSDPLDPKPPNYTIYTGLSVGEYFKLFWVLMVIHHFSNIIWKLISSPTFRKEASALDMFIHSIENCNLPAIWKDWDEDVGDIKDHLQRQKVVRQEMLTTMVVNFLFNGLMLIPLTYTLNNIFGRHKFLEDTIGTTKDEDYSYANATKLLCVGVSGFLGLSLMELGLFLIYNNFVSDNCPCILKD